jgi:hypothetical protein
MKLVGFRHLPVLVFCAAKFISLRDYLLTAITGSFWLHVSRSLIHAADES